MKELSLNILDIAENSAKAKATLISILIREDDNTLELSISDNGIGMTKETVLGVCDPFYTTRATRKVGMGIPLLKLAAEQTEGKFNIESRHVNSYPNSHGTTVTALFFKKHIDFTPLGDVIASITTLVQGHPDIDFVFMHKMASGSVNLDTRDLRAVLEDVPLDTYEVLSWIKDNLEEQYVAI